LNEDYNDDDMITNMMKFKNYNKTRFI